MSDIEKCWVTGCGGRIKPTKQVICTGCYSQLSKSTQSRVKLAKSREKSDHALFTAIIDEVTRELVAAGALQRPAGLPMVDRRAEYERARAGHEAPALSPTRSDDRAPPLPTPSPYPTRGRGLDLTGKTVVVRMGEAYFIGVFNGVHDLGAPVYAVQTKECPVYIPVRHVTYIKEFVLPAEIPEDIDDVEGGTPRSPSTSDSDPN